LAPLPKTQGESRSCGSPSLFPPPAGRVIRGPYHTRKASNRLCRGSAVRWKLRWKWRCAAIRYGLLCCDSPYRTEDALQAPEERPRSGRTNPPSAVGLLSHDGRPRKQRTERFMLRPSLRRGSRIKIDGYGLGITW